MSPVFHFHPASGAEFLEVLVRFLLPVGILLILLLEDGGGGIERWHLHELGIADVELQVALLGGLELVNRDRLDLALGGV